MEIGVSDSTAFKGNLVTTLKGRGSILEPVAKEFANLTKGIEGDLYLRRGDSILFDRDEHVLELAHGKAEVVTTSMHKLLSIDPKTLTQKGIKAVAKEFADIFKALKQQDRYISRMEPAYKEYSDSMKQVTRLSGERKRAERFGFNALANIFSKTIEKHQASADASLAKLDKGYQDAVKKMRKYDDNILGKELVISVPEPQELNLYY